MFLDQGATGIESRYYVHKESRGWVCRCATEVTQLVLNPLYGLVSKAAGFFPRGRHVGAHPKK